MVSHLSRIGDKGEDGIVQVVIHLLEDLQHHIAAKSLPLMVDIDVAPTGEVDPLKGARPILLRLDHLLQMDILTTTIYRNGLSSLELMHLVEGEIERCLDHWPLRGDYEDLIVIVVIGGTDAPGVAHRIHLATTGHTAEDIASVKHWSALPQRLQRIDMILYILRDVHPLEPLCHAVCIAALHLTIESMTEELHEHACVRSISRMLSASGDVLEYILDCGEVKVPTHGECLSPPVITPQRRLEVLHARLPGRGVAQMPHVTLPDVGSRLDVEAVVRLLVGDCLIDGVMYGIEDLRDSSRPESPLPVEVLRTHGSLKLDAGDTCTILSTIVLLLHHQVELIETIASGAVFLPIILERLPKPDKYYSTLVL